MIRTDRPVTRAMVRTSSALVTICTFCHSAVARGDRRLEDWGKVAALAPTGSSFELGMTGRHDGKPFEIVGHVQYEHAAGGFWDEWYAAFGIKEGDALFIPADRRARIW